MRQYKKLILMLVVLLFSVTNVYAAETSANVILNSSATEIKKGDTFTITLTAKSENGIEGLDSTLKYDTTKLELTNKDEINDASLSGTDAETGDYKLTFIVNSESTVTEKKFTTLNFKVLDNVTEDELLTITLADIDFKDSADSDNEIEDKNVTLKVVSDEINNGDEPTDDPTDEPTDDPTDEPSGDENNPSDDGNEPAGDEQKPPKHEYAGLEDYTFAIIVGVVIIAIISYVKYKKYTNI